MKCPHCGAPPPPGFVAPAGQFSYRCAYCSLTSTQGTAAPAPSPSIFILEHHHVDEDRAPVVPSRSSWLVWLVVIILVSAGGSGAGLMRCSGGTKGNAILSGLVWSGSEPLVCSGNDDIAVSGVTATFSAGPAIQASGNCHVRCTDCSITAASAIDATGNAEVVIVNGSVKGTPLLASASGNAHVTIAGNVLASGATKQSGNATISAPAPPVTATPIRPTAKKR